MLSRMILQRLKRAYQRLASFPFPPEGDPMEGIAELPARPLEPDVLARIRSDFPAAQHTEVAQWIAHYGKRETHNEVARVQLAVLVLAQGDIKLLQHYAIAALTDYRNVLSWAYQPDPPA